MRKKIIFITKFLPMPAYNGGAIRNLHWIKFLSRKYDIILVGFWNDKYNLKENNSKNGCNIIGEFLDRTLAKKAKLLTECIFRGKSFILRQYYSDGLADKIKDIVKNNKIEFVFCSELSTMQHADYFIDKKIPVYFDDHNVEYRLYERMAKFSNFLFKYFLKRESNIIKKFEKKSLQLSRHAFSVSDEDGTELNNLSSNFKNITVIKNSFVDSREICTELSKNPKMVFVGNLSWRPNKHGLEYFILKILPKILIKIPGVELYVIGSNFSSYLKKISLGMPVRFFVDANDEEKRRIINISWVGIVPLYFASGTRIKIIEYWSHGKAVVSTEIGAEGLEKSKGTLIVKSDGEFIDKIVSLLKNRDVANSLGMENHKIFKNFYDFETVYEENIFDFLS